MAGAQSVQEKWDGIYRTAAEQVPEACWVLAENAHLLPAGGSALDLACGLGGNALFLAGLGFSTHAWDLSPMAIARLQAAAGRLGLTVAAAVRDVERSEFPRTAFDVIVVSHFLARPLAGSIMAALKPGGLLFYQTFTEEKISENGPSNADFLLAVNELPALFGGLRLVFYREEGRIGDISRGKRNLAYYIGQKHEHRPAAWE